MSTIGCSPSRTRAVASSSHSHAVYDAGSTKSLLSDYALWHFANVRPPARPRSAHVLTVWLCYAQLEFMKWLEHLVPAARLENELRHSAEPRWAAPSTCAREYSPMCRTMLANGFANRHPTRRERLHSRSRRIERVGRELYRRLRLPSRTVRRCSLPNQALQQTRLAALHHLSEPCSHRGSRM